MRLRRSSALIAVAMAAAGSPVAAPAPPAVAQTEPESGVEELWEEYPLQEERPEPSADGPAADPAQDPEAPAAPDAAEDASPEAAGQTPGTADGQGSGRPAATDAQPPAAGSDPAAGLPVAAAAGAVAGIAVGLLVLLLIARRRRGPAPAAIQPFSTRQVHNVYAVGSTERDGIGEFEGFVHAMAPAPGEDDELLALGDPSDAATLWVRRSEVAHLRAVHAVGEDEPAEHADAGESPFEPFIVAPGSQAPEFSRGRSRASGRFEREERSHGQAASMPDASARRRRG